MGKLGRGWRLARQSMVVVTADGTLTALVVLGGITGLATAAVFLVPAAVAHRSDDDALAGLCLVVGTYAMTFFSVYFGVALAAAAADVLDGRDASTGRSLSVATSRLGQVAGWALVLATVNLLLQVLRSRGGIAGAILSRLGNVAWGLATFLVVPILAFEGAGPTDAVGRSARLFRQRWGEQIVGQFSIGVVFGLAMLVPIAFVFLVVVGGATTSVIILSVVIAAVLVVVIGILGAAARAVFAVALYRFAAGVEAIGPFAYEDLAGAVRPR